MCRYCFWGFFCACPVRAFLPAHLQLLLHQPCAAPFTSRRRHHWVMVFSCQKPALTALTCRCSLRCVVLCLSKLWGFLLYFFSFWTVVILGISYILWREFNWLRVNSGLLVKSGLTNPEWLAKLVLNGTLTVIKMLVSWLGVNLIGICVRSQNRGMVEGERSFWIMAWAPHYSEKGCTIIIPGYVKFKSILTGKSNTMGVNKDRQALWKPIADRVNA